MIKRSLLLKGCLALSGIAIVTSSFVSQSNSTANPNVSQEETQTDRRTLHPKEIAVDFRAIAKQAIPAVVSIKVQSKKQSAFGEDAQSEDPFDLFGNDLWGFFNLPKKDRDSSRSLPIAGQASGVIVSQDGYILTNSHVVHNMEEINILLHDGREFAAKVLGDDPNSEIALIKIDAQNLPFLKLGDSDDLEVGQWVAAIGNPLGLQATLTVGVVSAKGRNNLDIARFEDFIQTDAAIYRGNSGGALVNLNGEVIGINTAIATNASSGYMGIGFAIPSNIARHIMEEVISTGKVSRGFLGVALQSIDYNLAQAFNLEKVQGAIVTNVIKDSPAEKAGLQTDDIVLKYDNHLVENAASLRNGIYILKPGSRAVLTVSRHGKSIEIPIEIGDFAEDRVLSKISQSNRLGIEVEQLTPDLAKTLGYLNDYGVVITKVSANSVANLAGLKKDSLILSVNRKKVENVEEFNEAMRETPKDRPVLLQVKQGNQYVYLSLKSQ